MNKVIIHRAVTQRVHITRTVRVRPVRKTVVINRTAVTKK